MNTFAPNDFAISIVRSVEPESTTMISPVPSGTSGCTLESVRPILASSLWVMMTTESVTLVRIPDARGDGNRKQVLRFAQDDSPQWDAKKNAGDKCPAPHQSFASEAP